MGHASFLHQKAIASLSLRLMHQLARARVHASHAGKFLLFVILSLLFNCRLRAIC